LKLDLDAPQELTFIPENVDTAESVDDFIFPDTLTDIKKTLRIQAISIPVLGNVKAKMHGRKSVDIYLPALFLGTAALASPHLISITLNVVSSYVYDFFKGTPGQTTASLEILMSPKGDGKIKKISYKGPAEGIKDLSKVIKELNK